MKIQKTVYVHARMRHSWEAPGPDEHLKYKVDFTMFEEGCLEDAVKLGEIQVEFELPEDSVLDEAMRTGTIQVLEEDLQTELANHEVRVNNLRRRINELRCLPAPTE